MKNTNHPRSSYVKLLLAIKRLQTHALLHVSGALVLFLVAALSLDGAGGASMAARV
jgi:hypothetical protein